MRTTTVWSDELQEHITVTYFALRRGLVVVSVLLPLVLAP